MMRPFSVLAVSILSLAACKKASKEVTGPPPPAPTVQTISVSPAAANLSSLGATTALTAEVRLSNGAVGTQAVTWASSSPAVATVAGGTVTAVGNGTTTISASIGSVSGSATITVAQVVASVRLLPADTVIKGPAQLRGAAVDARGNPVPGASVTWVSLTPTITTVTETGALTPVSTGVARIRLTAGTLSSTAIVRTVWNVRQLSDLFPLFEYTAAAGQRRAISDVSQAHADARAAVIAPVWTYMEAILPTSGSVNTSMYFTTWSQIWTEVTPFCGGQLLANQTAWTACTTPTTQHFIIPESGADDFPVITRFLTRQWWLASHFDSRVYPWWVEGWSQWLGGGSVEGPKVAGKPRAVAIADFKSGDTQQLLAPLDTLMRLPSARFYENLPQRTPVAVRMAQGVMFVGYLNKEYPALLDALYARVRALPGAGITNEAFIQEIATRTGRTVAQLEAGYLAYARGL